MAPWICSKESVGKFCRIVSAAAPIPILVDDGCQRDTAPRHVIAATAHFNVFVLHQDRLPYFSYCGRRRPTHTTICGWASPPASPKSRRRCAVHQRTEADLRGVIV